MKRHEQAGGHMIMARGSGANSSDQAILIWAGLWSRNYRYWQSGIREIVAHKIH